MSRRELSKRKVLLGVTGSIAAYKACMLVRLLKAAGADVRVIMTASASHFVGETTLACLSGNAVSKDLFDSGTPCEADHISLSNWADIIVVAPATANIIGKAAAGLADDLLSTTILSGIQKVLFAPAMNAAMYSNPLVQQNIEKLRGAGCAFVGPESGELACGEEGAGRLAEPELIVETIKATLSQPG
jgi:phosphopantothenoylcysteine decarboxylase/phosphopantothenate--cysteine ligase